MPKKKASTVARRAPSRSKQKRTSRHTSDEDRKSESPKTRSLKGKKRQSGAKREKNDTFESTSDKENHPPARPIRRCRRKVDISKQNYFGSDDNSGDESCSLRSNKRGRHRDETFVLEGDSKDSSAEDSSSEERIPEDDVDMRDKSKHALITIEGSSSESSFRNTRDDSEITRVKLANTDRFDSNARSFFQIHRQRTIQVKKSDEQNKYDIEDGMRDMQCNGIMQGLTYDRHVFDSDESGMESDSDAREMLDVLNECVLHSDDHSAHPPSESSSSIPVRSDRAKKGHQYRKEDESDSDSDDTSSDEGVSCVAGFAGSRRQSANVRSKMQRQNERMVQELREILVHPEIEELEESESETTAKARCDLVESRQLFWQRQQAYESSINFVTDTVDECIRRSDRRLFDDICSFCVNSLNPSLESLGSSVKTGHLAKLSELLKQQKMPSDGSSLRSSITVPPQCVPRLTDELDLDIICGQHRIPTALVSTGQTRIDSAVHFENLALRLRRDVTPFVVRLVNQSLEIGGGNGEECSDVHSGLISGADDRGSLMHVDQQVRASDLRIGSGKPSTQVLRFREDTAGGIHGSRKANPLKSVDGIIRFVVGSVLEQYRRLKDDVVGGSRLLDPQKDSDRWSEMNDADRDLEECLVKMTIEGVKSGRLLKNSNNNHVIPSLKSMKSECMVPFLRWYYEFSQEVCELHPYYRTAKSTFGGRPKIIIMVDSVDLLASGVLPHLIETLHCMHESIVSLQNIMIVSDDQINETMCQDCYSDSPVQMRLEYSNRPNVHLDCESEDGCGISVTPDVRDLDYTFDVPNIPFILILGISTGEHMLAVSLDEEYDLLKIAPFQFQSSLKLYRQIAEDVLFHSLPIMFDHNVITQLLQNYEYFDHSIGRFQDQIWCLLIHHLISEVTSDQSGRQLIEYVMYASKLLRKHKAKKKTKQKDHQHHIHLGRKLQFKLWNKFLECMAVGSDTVDTFQRMISNPHLSDDFKEKYVRIANEVDRKLFDNETNPLKEDEHKMEELKKMNHGFIFTGSLRCALFEAVWDFQLCCEKYNRSCQILYHLMNHILSLNINMSELRGDLQNHQLFESKYLSLSSDNTKNTNNILYLIKTLDGFERFVHWFISELKLINSTTMIMTEDEQSGDNNDNNNMAIVNRINEMLSKVQSEKIKQQKRREKQQQQQPMDHSSLSSSSLGRSRGTRRRGGGGRLTRTEMKKQLRMNTPQYLLDMLRDEMRVILLDWITHSVPEIAGLPLSEIFVVGGAQIMHDRLCVNHSRRLHQLTQKHPCFETSIASDQEEIDYDPLVKTYSLWTEFSQSINAADFAQAVSADICDNIPNVDEQTGYDEFWVCLDDLRHLTLVKVGRNGDMIKLLPF